MTPNQQPNLQLRLERFEDEDQWSDWEESQDPVTTTTPLSHNLCDHQDGNSRGLDLTTRRTSDDITAGHDKMDDNNNLRAMEDQQHLVAPAQEWHDDLKEDYEMSAKERGLCLIINNVEFEGSLFPTRKGSDKDAWEFRKTFESLGFKVHAKRNVNSEKMQYFLGKTAALCTDEHDALIIIVLSHGSEHGVYGVDGIELDSQVILTHFDNRNCKAMRDKPKVFIIQACRGRAVDYGVHYTQPFSLRPESQSYSQPSQMTQANTQVTRRPFWIDFDEKHNPIRADVLMCFSTQAGFVSNRNEQFGSWLGYYLVKRLREEAHRRHFMDILNMVSRDIRKLVSSQGFKQVLEVTTIGFDKNLYFNPGLYRVKVKKVKKEESSENQMQEISVA